MENNNLQTILSTMIQHLGALASSNQQILLKLDEVLVRLQKQEPVQVQVQEPVYIPAQEPVQVQVQEPMPVHIPAQEQVIDVQPTSIDNTVAELVASSNETNASADDIIQKISAELLGEGGASADNDITIPTGFATQAVAQEPVKTREQCIEEITAGLQFDPALVGSVLQTTNSGVTDPMVIAGNLGTSVETVTAILGLGRDGLVKHITALAAIQALPY